MLFLQVPSLHVSTLVSTISEIFLLAHRMMVPITPRENVPPRSACPRGSTSKIEAMNPCQYTADVFHRLCGSSRPRMAFYRLPTASQTVHTTYHVGSCQDPRTIVVLSCGSCLRLATSGLNKNVSIEPIDASHHAPAPAREALVIWRDHLKQALPSRTPRGHNHYPLLRKESSSASSWLLLRG